MRDDAKMRGWCLCRVVLPILAFPILPLCGTALAQEMTSDATPAPVTIETLAEKRLWEEVLTAATEELKKSPANPRLLLWQVRACRMMGKFAVALTFDYGQRHRFEIEAARRIAEAYAAKGHVVVNMDLRVFGNSALTTNIDVPKNRSAQEIGKGIPITYVPARNTIFLSFALAYAEMVGAEDIFIGVNALDYSGYPDCRPEFIEAYQNMADLATKAGVEGRQKLTIHAPLITFTKAEIIRQGMELGVDYSLTSSCYDPSADGRACGDCDSCTLRRKGFKEAGVVDPTPYVIVR